MIITEKDIGRKVVSRDGNIGKILKIDSYPATYPVLVAWGDITDPLMVEHMLNGKFYDDNQDCIRDIVKFVENEVSKSSTESPWLPIEQAPKDGSWFIARERIHLIDENTTDRVKQELYLFRWDKNLREEYSWMSQGPCAIVEFDETKLFSRYGEFKIVQTPFKDKPKRYKLREDVQIFKSASVNEKHVNFSPSGKYSSGFEITAEAFYHCFEEVKE